MRKGRQDGTGRAGLVGRRVCQERQAGGVHQGFQFLALDQTDVAELRD